MARYYDPGAVGANDGTSWANAWTNLQTANNAVTQALSPLYLRNTTGSNIVIGSTITLGTNSGTEAGGHLRWIGCNPAGVVDGTRVVFDGNNGAYNTFTLTTSLRTLENLEFTNAGSTKASIYSTTGTHWHFQNCKFYPGASAYSYAINMTGCNFCSVVDCQVLDYWSSSLPVIYPVTMSTTNFVRLDFIHVYYGLLLSGTYGSTIVDSVFHDCGNGSSAALVTLSESVTVVNSVFDSCVNGCYLEYPRSMAIGCRFTNNTNALAGIAYMAYGVGCTFRNNTNDTLSYVTRLWDGPTLTSDGYVDAANHDFRLVYTDPARSVQIGQYIPIKAYTPAGLGIMEQPRRRVQAIGL